MLLRTLPFGCGRILSLYAQTGDLIENSPVGVNLQTGQSSISIRVAAVFSIVNMDESLLDWIVFKVYHF